MTTQVRIFTIQPGKLNDFVAAWVAGVYPLRLKYGFRIDGAWIVEERNQFIWVLSYDGLDDWETCNTVYYASAERAALDPDPVWYIERSENWFVTSVASAPLQPTVLSRTSV